MTGISHQAPSAFESYNARTKRPAEVARTFIPPPAFQELAKPTHAVLVGPRGSGKTTLLKMLQGEALEAWEHEEGDRYRAQVDFTGVFIPADVSWSEQVAALATPSLSMEYSSTINQAAFSTHVLRSLVNAMDYRVHPPSDPSLLPHRRQQLDRWQEAELVTSVADAWMLAPAVPNLRSLAESLLFRLADIARIARQEVARGPHRLDERLAAVPWLHMDVLTSTTIAVDKFNRLIGEPDARWALLLDELELAPSAIVQQLLKALRSTDERLLFKLAYSPFGTDLQVLDRDSGASPTQDYTPIPLYYANKEDGIRFTRALISKMIADRRLSGLSLEQVLGRSLLDYDPADSADTANVRRRQVEAMYLDLAHVDKSFRRYLLNRGIDPNKLSEIRGAARAADIRKVVGLVPIRLAYKRSSALGGGQTRRLRTRKNPSIYWGSPALLAMLEGNPRWTIGVTSRLLDRYELRQRRVSAAAQSAEMANASARFLALLRTIATSPNSSRDENQLTNALLTTRVPSVFQLVEAIGTYFAEQIVGDEFDPDPYGTFRVDPAVSDATALMLGRALNAGAIILVPEKGDAPMTSSVRGRRFRLSYLLAPHYHLPLRLDRPISLSAILNANTPPIISTRRREVSLSMPGQLEIPVVSERTQNDSC